MPDAGPDQQHIAQTMGSSTTASSSSDVPIRTEQPSSAFSAFRRRASSRRADTRCGHITMTRLYHMAYRCESCQRQNLCGWLYRCTQDREILIQDRVDSGAKMTFDGMSEMFLDQMSLGKRGPDVRSDKYSFLKETSAEELQSYSPEQIATILSQRENVQKTIAQERQSGTLLRGLSLLSSKKPWVPKPGGECQRKLCPSCHSNGKAKSWLSLNGILNGDIPPTAATGFSFAHMQERPLLNPDVVKNVGLRAVPLRRPHELLSFSPSSPSSTWSVMDVADGHDNAGSASIRQETKLADELTTAAENQPETLPPQQSPDTAPRGQKRAAEDAEAPARASPVAKPLPTIPAVNERLIIRAPWTPPPTPILEAVEDSVCPGGSIGSVLQPSLHDGRSPSSLKTNPYVRHAVFSSVEPHRSRQGSSSNIGTRSGESDRPRTEGADPYVAEEECDVGLCLPFNQEVFDRALQTPLPRPNIEEELFFAQELGSELGTVIEKSRRSGRSRSNSSSSRRSGVLCSGLDDIPEEESMEEDA